MNYYTSDWHLFHKNIIRYSNRPFASVGEMNRAIIDRTNERVGPGDTLYILGDVGFARPEEVLPLLVELRCKSVHLIRGNHDSDAISKLQVPVKDAPMKTRPYWTSVRDLAEINDGGHKVVLCHFAMRTWNRAHHGAYMLHGHSHGSLPPLNNQSLDVGVDCWDFYPVTLSECIDRLRDYPPYKAEDHHRT